MLSEAEVRGELNEFVFLTIKKEFLKKPSYEVAASISIGQRPMESTDYLS